MKIFIKSAVAVLATVFALNASALEVDGSAGVSTDYIFRGMSQNDNWAVSADVNVSQGGLYAGVWGSQVDYGTDLEVEYDLYAGYGFGNDDFSVDVGYIDYNYSAFDKLADFEESASDVEEVFGKISLKHVSVAYYLGLDDAPDYYEVGVDVMGHFDFTFGDYETAGTHWKISKGFKVFEGTPAESDLEVGFVEFTADDSTDLMDEKQAYFSITKKLF